MWDGTRARTGGAFTLGQEELPQECEQGSIAKLPGVSTFCKAKTLCSDCPLTVAHLLATGPGVQRWAGVGGARTGRLCPE